MFQMNEETQMAVEGGKSGIPLTFIILGVTVVATAVTTAVNSWRGARNSSKILKLLHSPEE